MFANKLIGIVCSVSALVRFVKIIFNFASAFEKQYHKKCASMGNVNILAELMSSDFLTGLRVHSRFQKIHVSEMILRQEGLFALVRSYNDHEFGSRSLRTSN